MSAMPGRVEVHRTSASASSTSWMLDLHAVSSSSRIQPRGGCRRGRAIGEQTFALRARAVGGAGPTRSAGRGRTPLRSRSSTPIACDGLRVGPARASATRCGRPRRPLERVLFQRLSGQTAQPDAGAECAHARRVAPRGRRAGWLVAAVRAFNRHGHGDARVDRRLVPTGNAMTLARKRRETRER